MTKTMLIKGFNQKNLFSTIFPNLHATLTGNWGNRLMASTAVNYIFVPASAPHKAMIHVQGERYPTESVKPSTELLSDFAIAGIELVQVPMNDGQAYIVPSKVASINDQPADYVSRSIIKFLDGKKIISARSWKKPGTLGVLGTETPLLNLEHVRHEPGRHSVFTRTPHA